MGKTVAIMQSNYIPWKGYFDMINSVDEFILFDDVQYTKRNWRNRNIIKTNKGNKWITIPVKMRGNFKQAIRDTKISDKKWPKRHWDAIRQTYAQAPYFREYKSVFEELYLNTNEDYLSEVNRRFLQAVMELLGIHTKLSWSFDYELMEGMNEKPLSICHQSGATKLVNGETAKEYLDVEMFNREGVSIEWFDVSDYPQYPQLHPPFDHYVTILDLIFNTGENAVNYMKSYNGGFVREYISRGHSI